MTQLTRGDIARIQSTHDHKWHIDNDGQCEVCDLATTALETLDARDLWVEYHNSALDRAHTAEARCVRLEAGLREADDLAAGVKRYTEVMAAFIDGPRGEAGAFGNLCRQFDDYKKARAILTERDDDQEDIAWQQTRSDAYRHAERDDLGKGGTPDLSKNWTDYSFAHLAEDTERSDGRCEYGYCDIPEHWDHDVHRAVTELDLEKGVCQACQNRRFVTCDHSERSENVKGGV